MDKLSGNKRKILRYIYKHQKDNLTRFNIVDKFSHIPNVEIKKHVEALRKEDFIYYSGLNDNLKLTSKGLSYLSLETQDNIETCIKSILFPIVVAFITTLITLWLKGSL